jgi:long-chain acyl-CoA synthetase
VGALIIPSFANLKAWCSENAINFNNGQTILDPKVNELYENEIRRYDKFFNHVEQVKKFELLPNEWSVETGELTPKLSLRRKVILEKNKDALRNIYSS